MLRLKMSPKEALLKIDQQVLKGVNLLKNCAPELENHAVPYYESYVVDDDLALAHGYNLNKNFNRMRQEVNQWAANTSKLLESIFLDTTPLYIFRTAHMDSILEKELIEKRAMFVIGEHLKNKLNVLKDFYASLLSYFRLPLLYLPENGTLCFYDFVCPIVGEGEKALCAFMFSRDIGKVYDFIDIQHDMPRLKNDTGNNCDRQIINAAEGVNKKTTERFGFGIFSVSKKEKTVVIKIPKGLFVTSLH